MASKKKAAAGLTTAITPASVGSITESTLWEKLKTKLNEDEQKLVQEETRSLAVAMVQLGTSRLSIGEHLVRLQGVLEPHNLFGRYLKNFNFSKRTAYRYIKGFQNAKALLPAKVLEVAMARGVNIIGETEAKPLGIYTAAVAKLPIPTNANEQQAVTYLDQLENVRKQDRSTSDQLFAVAVPQDPTTLLKECYRFVALRYRRLPNNSRQRANWIRSLVGMLLADLGVGGQQTFSPQAVPEGFKAPRGGARQVASA